MSDRPDISAIILGHGEGRMAGVSLRSLTETVEAARAKGITVEVLAMLDTPTEATKRAFASLEKTGQLTEVALRDQGRARNHASELARGRYLAFLDADDLWSENWLAEAFLTCEADPDNVIAHPEFDWYFGENGNVFITTDDEDPSYDVEFMRYRNYWDAMCLAPRRAHIDHPYSTRDKAAGFAFEDWHWNCQTIAASFRHKVTAGTIHFKRRRLGSQNLEAVGFDLLPPMNEMFDHRWYKREG